MMHAKYSVRKATNTCKIQKSFFDNSISASSLRIAMTNIWKSNFSNWSNNVFLVPWCSTTGEKSPAQGFLTWKKQSLQHRGDSPVQGFFCENSISPAQEQSFTHRGTLKTQSPHTPQYRAYAQRNFEGPTHTGNFEKFQSPDTPQHRARTQGTLKKLKVPTHHNTGPTHRKIIFPIGKFSEKNNLFQHGIF